VRWLMRKYKHPVRHKTRAARALGKRKTLTALPDSKVDCSHIPLPDESFWQTTRTLHLGPDILAWFMPTGKGDQPRINAILREAMPHSMRGQDT